VLSQITLSEKALLQNYKIFCDLLGTEQTAPVVKSNAYGHGIEPIHRLFKKSSPKWLCVTYLDEAEKLRSLGFKNRILVCGAVTADLLPRAKAATSDISIGSWEALREAKSFPDLKIHLEFDTGMSRLGFKPEEANKVIQEVRPMKDSIVGLCMHFANVEDVTDQAYARQQLASFQNIVKEFESAGFTKLLKHTAASAPALLFDEARFDLSRVGISTYGLWPSQVTKVSFLQHTKRMVDLVPVMSWTTSLVQINPIKSGQFIGYGCSYKARKDMKVGVVPVGYYEGYPRSSSSSGAYVLIRGERCPIVGRICMNMMMVDVTEIKDPKVGDVVTLIGKSESESISIDDLANWSDTINYEIVSRIHPDIPRVIQS